MAQKESLEKLSKIIDEVSTKDTHIFYRNTFVIACYLTIEGNTRAAKKHLKYFFDVLGRDNRNTYFLKISDTLEEYAAEYASEIAANLEINELLDDYR